MHALLFAIIVSLAAVPPPEGTGEPELLFGWSDFMHAEEEDAIAVLGPPDTTLVSGEERALLYRGHVAHLFRFTNGLLDEETYMTYIPGRDSVQQVYDSLAAAWRTEKGTPSMEIDTGAMWILTSESAGDSLATLVARIRDPSEIPPDSLTLGRLLEVAAEPVRAELVGLLRRQRVERIYIQPLFGTNIYSVTRTREAGIRALWDEEGNLRGLGAL